MISDSHEERATQFCFFDYELIRIITESTDGADCLFNFCTSVGWGVMHERLKRLEDLNAVCLWKDDGVSCRPLGLCSIFTRSAERCIALQERDWAEQFCTTQLPEVAKARAEALEDATVTTATAELSRVHFEVHLARTRLGRGDGRSRRPRGGRGCGGARPCASQLPEELRVLQERHSPVRPHRRGAKLQKRAFSGYKHRH